MNDDRFAIDPPADLALRAGRYLVPAAAAVLVYWYVADATLPEAALFVVVFLTAFAALQYYLGGRGVD